MCQLRQETQASREGALSGNCLIIVVVDSSCGFDGKTYTGGFRLAGNQEYGHSRPNYEHHQEKEDNPNPNLSLSGVQGLSAFVYFQTLTQHLILLLLQLDLCPLCFLIRNRNNVWRRSKRDIFVLARCRRIGTCSRCRRCQWAARLVVWDYYLLETTIG